MARFSEENGTIVKLSSSRINGVSFFAGCTIATKSPLNRLPYTGSMIRVPAGRRTGAQQDCEVEETPEQQGRAPMLVRRPCVSVLAGHWS